MPEIWLQHAPGWQSCDVSPAHVRYGVPRRLVAVPRCHAAALERLDIVAAPAPSQVAPLEAVLSALRATQQALEATQTSTFGAQVHLYCMNEAPLNMLR